MSNPHAYAVCLILFSLAFVYCGGRTDGNGDASDTWEEGISSDEDGGLFTEADSDAEFSSDEFWQEGEYQDEGEDADTDWQNGDGEGEGDWDSDQRMRILLSVPNSVNEGEGIVENAGEVSLSVPAPESLSIDIVSSDTTELMVPSNVVISSGSDKATFDLTVIDDDLDDGEQSVEVTASAEGWDGAKKIVAVLDNEQHDRQWHPTNPGGGGAFGPVEAGPTGIIMVASDLSGPYISYDHGISWKPLGPSNGITETHACGLGFDPVDAAVMFVGTEKGLFRSEDGGSSFIRVLDWGYITDIKFSPTNHSIGFLSIHGKWNVADGRVFRSDDNGRTWYEASNGLPDNLHILKLELDPSDPNRLFVVAGAGRFASGPAVCYLSENGGNSWRQVAGNLGDTFDVAIAPRQPSTVYLTTFSSSGDDDGACFVSDDGGLRWTALGEHTGVIWLDPENERVVRLIDVRYQFPWDVRNGVWQSDDSGSTWYQLSSVDEWDKGWTDAYWAYGDCFNGSVKTLGRDLSDRTTIYWANGQWLFASFDGGARFTQLFTDEVAPGRWRSRGLDNVIVSVLASSSADSQTIYVGYMDLGLFCSEDGGETWQNRNHPDYTGGWNGSGGNTTALAVDPNRPGVVWASQAGSPDGMHTLLKSTDRGVHWTPVVQGLPSSPMSGLSVDPESASSSRRLFITVGGDVYRSDDDGRSWSEVLVGKEVHFTAINPGNGDFVFVGGEGGLWRSSSGGDSGTWEEVGTVEMKGNRGSEFWTSDWSGVSSIYIDPNLPDVVYATVYGNGGGIYRSSSNGDTDSWTKIFDNHYMRNLLIVPHDSNHIIATSTSNMYSGGYSEESLGVIESIDGGLSWHRLNEGLTWPFANPIAISETEPFTIFIGSPGQGICWRRF